MRPKSLENWLLVQYTNVVPHCTGARKCWLTGISSVPSRQVGKIHFVPDIYLTSIWHNLSMTNSIPPSAHASSPSLPHMSISVKESRQTQTHTHSLSLSYIYIYLLVRLWNWRHSDRQVSTEENFATVTVHIARTLPQKILHKNLPGKQHFHYSHAHLYNQYASLHFDAYSDQYVVCII